MVMYGAEPEELDRLAASMLQSAETFENLMVATNGALQATSWTGEDAELFRSDWHSTHTTSLITAISRLREASSLLKHEAEQQRIASAADLATGQSGKVAFLAADAVAAALLSGMSRAQISAYIRSLSPSALSALINDEPGIIGNTDGVPLPVRDRANRLALQNALAQATASGDASKQQFLRGLLASVSNPNTSLLVFDPANDRYAVGMGDIATAKHVAIMVPGFSFNPDQDMLKGWIPYSNRIMQAAAANDPSTAVIMWKGYHDPSGPDVATMGDAQQGAAALTSFASGLGLDPHQSLTVVAHSYGSVVTGYALANDHLTPTNVIAVGSPGMTVDNVGQLHLTAGQFFDESAPGDPVTDFGYFGTDPSSPTFGGVRLDTGASGIVIPNFGIHSSYFDAGSQSLSNIADVVTGNTAAAHVSQFSPGDYAAAATRAILDPGQSLLDDAARDYSGPGSTPFQVVVHADDAITNVVGSAVGDGTNFVLDTGSTVLNGITNVLHLP